MEHKNVSILSFQEIALTGKKMCATEWYWDEPLQRQGKKGINQSKGNTFNQICL